LTDQFDRTYDYLEDEIKEKRRELLHTKALQHYKFNNHRGYKSKIPDKHNETFDLYSSKYNKIFEDTGESFYDTNNSNRHGRCISTDRRKKNDVSDLEVTCFKEGPFIAPSPNEKLRDHHKFSENSGLDQTYTLNKRSILRNSAKLGNTSLENSVVILAKNKEEKYNKEMKRRAFLRVPPITSHMVGIRTKKTVYTDGGNLYRDKASRDLAIL